ncbi:DUF4253 domain-containing protein [Nostocoides australiense]|uniref:DUF4253 domain-containing protein n=1 Tax=Nostocoides australiense TaxID=99480 RepID=UPI00138EE597|nr:DUF4253 domain-containing protein [Tetrasphaera australiensis]
MDDPRQLYADAGLALPPPTDRGEVRPGMRVLSLVVPETESTLEVWERLRDLHPHTGYWPIVVGEGLWESTIFEFGGPGSAQPYAAGDGRAWFEAKYAERFGEEGPIRGQAEPVPGTDTWDDLLGVTLGEATEIALVPAAYGWEAPSVLGWSGAVNYDIDESEHATVLRRWSGQWGLEVVGLSLDILSARIARPATTPEERLARAMEIYLYCPDAVDQGVGSIDALAAGTCLPAIALWWD